MTRSIRILVLVFLALGFVTVTGCGPSYTKLDNSPVGVFYPNPALGNGCVRMLGRSTRRFGPGIYVTVCQPIRISGLATATYSEMDGTGNGAGNREVARLEFSDDSVYVWTSTLRECGRIEYTGHQTNGFWMSLTDLWHKTWWFFGLLIGFAVWGLIASLFSGGGGGTWSGGGTLSGGGSWRGGGTYKP